MKAARPLLLGNNLLAGRPGAQSCLQPPHSQLSHFVLWFPTAHQTSVPPISILKGCVLLIYCAPSTGPHCSGELEIKAVSGETGMLVAELVGQLSVTSGIPESAPLLGFWMPCWVSSSQPAVWAISSPAQNSLCYLRANPRTPALLGNFARG